MRTKKTFFCPNTVNARSALASPVSKNAWSIPCPAPQPKGGLIFLVDENKKVGRDFFAHKHIPITGRSVRKVSGRSTFFFRGKMGQPTGLFHFFPSVHLPFITLLTKQRIKSDHAVPHRFTKQGVGRGKKLNGFINETTPTAKHS